VKTKMRSTPFTPAIMATFLLFATTMTQTIYAFSGSKTNYVAITPHQMSTTVAPTREKIKTGQKTGRKTDWTTGKDLEDDNDTGQLTRNVQAGDQLEWLQDDESVSRNDEDPFHILLLGTTFDKRELTIRYVGASLNNVLAMPIGDAEDAAEFADEHGFACLGTWPRKECLDYGRRLQQRELDCRVVPFCEGGGRFWQAKSAGGNFASSGSGNESGNSGDIVPGSFE